MVEQNTVGYRSKMYLLIYINYTLCGLFHHVNILDILYSLVSTMCLVISIIIIQLCSECISHSVVKIVCHWRK